MDITNSDLEVVVSSLVGTCNSLQECLQSLYGINEDELSQENCLYIDENIFCCVDCGWWCYQSEMTNDEDCDEWACNECRP